MRKIVLIISFLLANQFIQAQNIVLLEEFGNRSCAPCLRFRPYFDTLVAHNPGKVAVINYHAGWPGKDGFYSMNPGDNQNRIIYYQVTALPWIEANGQMFFSSELTQQVIDTLYAASSFLKLTAHHSVNKQKDSVDVSVNILSKKDFPEGYSLFIAIVGGEYRDALRQFVTPADGAELKKGLKGKEQSFQFKTALINSTTFHLEKMEIICFVQDTKTKKILQTAFSTGN